MKTIKMNYKYNLLLLSTFLFVGCTTKQKETKKKALIYGSWLLAEAIVVDNKKTNKEEDKLLKHAQDNKIVSKAVILSLFSDGTFTHLKSPNEYKNGKWNFINSKKAIVCNNSLSVDTFLLNIDEGQSNELVQILYGKEKTRLSYFQNAEELKDFKEDPFYAANNTWRVKPTTEETTTQIQDRLGNYFKHIAYLLKSATERKQTSVSFEFSQGIVKIFDGGIGINPLSIVPESWAKTFYKDEDAYVAYKMFEKYLTTSGGYKGAATGNWYKDDYNILTNIYGDLKEGKFPALTFNQVKNN
jgi:hypothetical protein